MSMTLTHGDSCRMLTGLWLVQIITHWSCDHHMTTNAEVWAEAVNLLPTNHHVRFCLYLKEQTRSIYARHTEYHIKLAPIAAHHMWDQFNKQHSWALWFNGPHMTISKNFGTWICVLRSQWQPLLCRSDFTINAQLLETISDYCALCMRYNTSKQAQHRWRSFTLRI